ncbi:hypothetical protein HK405_008558 [Cladochytrium tenue]|nr:hypothetical protein HK405_008558 [Cladochytrium tenue]
MGPKSKPSSATGAKKKASSAGKKGAAAALSPGEQETAFKLAKADVGLEVLQRELDFTQDVAHRLKAKNSEHRGEIAQLNRELAIKSQDRIDVTGQVPILVDRGHVVTQSHAILQYLEDAYPSVGRALLSPISTTPPPPTQPPESAYDVDVDAIISLGDLTEAAAGGTKANNSGVNFEVTEDAADVPTVAAAARARAGVLALLFEADEGLPRRLREVLGRHREVVAGSGGKAAQRARLDEAVAAFGAELDFWEQALDANAARTDGSGGWLAGPELSLADIGLFPALSACVERFGLRLGAQRPRLQAWYARMEARPSAVNSRPPHWDSEDESCGSGGCDGKPARGTTLLPKPFDGYDV